MVRVVNWNGRDVPEELKELPPGRYAVEALDEAPALTEGEEDGLRRALESLDAGRGRTLADVRATVDAVLRR